MSLEMQKMDVVYPITEIAKGPDHLELRYSLRSLDRQPWARNVFLVGHKPSWIKGDVFHISFRDQWNPIAFKDKNIIKKMLRACADERISDIFVANSDDQYWLKEVSPEDMLIPPREHPPQMDMERQKNPRIYPNRIFRNRWVKRQYETVEYLKKRGRSDICFDGHVPYLIDKNLYFRTMAKLPWEMGEGFLIVVYHGWNWKEIANGFRIEDRDGVLVRIKADIPKEEIAKRTEKALFMNHNNKGLGQGMKDFLQERFPNPSRWE